MKQAWPKRNQQPNKKQSKSVAQRDSLQVFCRLRPTNASETCIKVISDTVIQVTTPESYASARNVSVKQMQYTFQKVFDERSTQQQVFSEMALPLVDHLIHGRNGLLFTYGVTGSGKTYTMSGIPSDVGIMPRCLDILFNSIGSLQAKKFMFKPDKLNGFDVQTEAEALLDRQAEINSRSRPGLRKDKDLGSDPNLNHRTVDTTKIDGVDEDNAYAVFITYIEIYNNYVYDLLGEFSDGDSRSKVSLLKLIREDAAHNMYIHGVNEVEVKSPEEAFELYHKAQKRRRIAPTMSNAESSRGHSVFTIRLVQAPLDIQGDQIIQDRKMIGISQLSLVDLAGAERTSRTQNEGQRLKETGKINNSLMTLRKCLDTLRENQLTGNCSKIPPYRESRLTQLFKNYFEGEGYVRMIICVNPAAEDYSETLHVMNFSEVSQEVQVTAPTPMKPVLDNRFTPGRRKANQIFRKALKEIEDNGSTDSAHIPIDVGLVYSLGPAFPPMELLDPNDDQIIKNLARFLEARANRRAELMADIAERCANFRVQLLDVEKDRVLKDQENLSLKAMLDQNKKKMRSIETKTVDDDSKICNLQRELEDYTSKYKAVKEKLNEAEMKLQQLEEEKMRDKQRYNNKVATKTKELSREFELKMREEKELIEQNLRDKERRMKIARRALAPGESISSSSSTDNHHGVFTRSRRRSAESTISSDSDAKVPRLETKKEGPKTFVAVSSIRGHRRSRSMSHDQWLHHQPPTPVKLGTVFQPIMKKRKSVTKLTDVKDVTDSKTNKYCLVAQNQDTDGELETHLYKGDVVPTAVGGAQVILTDVETLKITSPVTSPVKKRVAAYNAAISKPKDVESRCQTAIEGHCKRFRR
nr:PREDICTED: kinesin-like protein KIF23 isoform X1 [Bemisia tabaci]